MKRQTNILEYLDNIVKIYPERIAYANESVELSFRSVYDNARAIGSFLHNEGKYKEPVVVFMKKHPDMINAFLGVVYGGSFYVPIDEEMPKHRIELIFQSLNPRAVICDDTTIESVKSFKFDGAVYRYNDMIKFPVNEDTINSIRDKSIDTDPIYIVFTSGSTGKPKGVVACHRSVIDYIETLTEVLEISEDTVFGNQTPLYVDACLKEIFPTLKFGAKTYIIPKELFMFPIKLVE
ncbi:MAG: AMP-binding protein, partial [Clostridiaceae bacterium]|nr:AMP-binding protein [Clostridiaceae bacterium]